jgi:hypothetical protein
VARICFLFNVEVCERDARFFCASFFTPPPSAPPLLSLCPHHLSSSPSSSFFVCCLLFVFVFSYFVSSFLQGPSSNVWFTSLLCTHNYTRDDDKQLDQIMQDIVEDLGPAGAAGGAGSDEMPTLEEDDEGDDIPTLEDDDSEDDMEDEVQLQVVDKKEGEGEKAKEGEDKGKEPAREVATGTNVDTSGTGVTEQQLQDVMANMASWMPIPGMNTAGGMFSSAFPYSLFYKNIKTQNLYIINFKQKYPCIPKRITDYFYCSF